MKSLPCSGILLPFMKQLSCGYSQNEHINSPKITNLYSLSWSCEVILMNFLFSGLFNGEPITPSFRIYLFFKSRKFNVLPNFTCGTEFNFGGNLHHYFWLCCWKKGGQIKATRKEESLVWQQLLTILERTKSAQETTVFFRNIQAQDSHEMGGYSFLSL